MLKRCLTLFAAFTVVLIWAWSMPVQQLDAKTKGRPSDTGQKKVKSPLTPIVRHSLKNDTSRPLRDMKPRGRKTQRPPHAPLLMPKAIPSSAQQQRDTVVDTNLVKGPMAPTPIIDFEGINNVNGVLPPDTTGDVGPNHYMQWVNLSLAVYDKSGNILLGPVDGSTIWDGFGDECESSNDGDPIVLYDHLADRWMISQFALPNFPNGPFFQCIAVSQTGDPTGSWHRYTFEASATKLNDYPHFGVWPDAYYMTANQFNAGTLSWGGAGVWAFDRDEMLQGNPATFVYFDLFGVDQNFGGMLPADLDGPAPPVGAPGLYIEMDDEVVFGTDRLAIWEFHVDFDTPGNSTFGLSGQPNLVLPTAPFQWGLCGFSRNCIDQPGTAQGLDAISDRLMFRIQYRNFGSYQTMVTNHTVSADGTDRAGIRWYELRDSGSGWAINQQGTYAPADGLSRWMGSAAMDIAGNIALGYSVSSSSVFPSIRYVSRLSTDTPGDMPQGEVEVIAGSGHQTFFDGRWGDYSTMQVDPVNGCDFWYTQEYIVTNGVAPWQTRVAAFTFAPTACSAGATGTLSGTVTDSSNSQPIEGALVEVDSLSTTTDVNGNYSFTLAAGTYDVDVSAYGYFSDSATGVVVTDGVTTDQDFALDPAPASTITGTVTDGSGHGWPLYARIDIDGYPGGPVFTNPVDGTYSVELVEATDYTFHVNAISAGYSEETRPVTPPTGGGVEDFALIVDQSTCNAPGYGFTGGLSEEFEGGSTPAGWTVLNNGADTDMEWRFDDPGGRGNLTGGTGLFAIADSDNLGCCGDPEDTEMRTPSLDFSSQATVFLEFDADFDWYDFSMDEKGDADVSTDGGATWTNVHRYQGADFRGPRHESIDISGIAGNQADVIVRFRFYDADFEFWWQVDNVRIGAVCGPIAGGLLVGNVIDENAAAGLNGATVTSDNEPLDTTTSFATPDDPNVDDGFYILFSSLTGAQPFTASKAGYGPDTQTPTIVADDTTAQDFTLGAGFIETDPDLLEATVDLGSSTTLQLTLNNTGTADANFEITEASGAAPLTIKNPALPRALPRAPSKAPIGPSSVRDFLLKNKAKKGKTANNPDWVEVSGLPGGLVRGAHAQCEDSPESFYMISGVDGTASITNNVWRYDAETDTWNALAPIPTPAEGPSGICYQGRIYVTGGDGGTQFQIYDIGTDTWLSGASLPRGVWGPSLGVWEGQLFMVGGDNDFFFGGTSNEVNIYDIASDTWTGTGATMPEGTVTSGWGQNGQYLYVVGGWNDSSPGANSSMTQRYDMAGDAWEVGPSFDSGRADMALSVSSVALYAAGGDGNGGGPFDAQTLVERLDLASWPGSWVDLADPLPSAVTANNSGACTTANTGGEVWSVGGGIPIGGLTRYRATGEGCFSVDIPWLSEDPTEGTVTAGGSVVIDVTLDAGVPEITQPGDYFAQLKIGEDTPYTVPNVPVIMHVPVPPDWGTLEGTVDGLGRCDAAGNPLEGATVFVDTAGTDFTLETDSTGHYQVSFLAADSPASITVSAAGYVAQTVSGVVITPQGTTTENFTLRLDAPCGDKSPTSFDVTVGQGETTVETLTLTNGGAGALTFNIQESSFPLPPLRPIPAKKAATKPVAKAAVGPLSVRAQVQLRAANVPVPSNAWFGGAVIPGGLVRFAHTQCDGQQNSWYIFSGVDGTGSIVDNSWRYDATTNTWNPLTPIPGGTEGPTATCSQGKIYVLGGDGGNTLHIYNVATDTWSSGANLPRGVWGAASASWAGKVYLVGGDSDFFFGGTSNEVNIYDIATDTWTGNGTVMPEAAVTAGSFQVGPYLYVVGGWGDLSPGVNVGASQRYELDTDTWTTGPALNTARSDLALSATDTALYAVGGDNDGGGPFDPTDIVERLEYATWPAGTWEDLADTLPIALTANNGGFCTEAITVASEVWSAGGLAGGITGNTFFRPSAPEHCFSIFDDVEWLSVDPATGSVPADSSLPINVNIDATNLALGDYSAVIVVTTNDPGAPQFNIPITLHVVEGCLYCEDFNDATPPVDWTTTGTWTQSGGVFSASPTKKASAIATPAFAGCDLCSVSATVSTSGGLSSRLWVYGWWVSKNVTIELLFKEANDKLIIKQRNAGGVVKKQNVPLTIDPNTLYDATMTYDGTNIVVNIDGVDVMTFAPIGSLPVGTLGVAGKASTVTVDEVSAND